MDSFTTNSIIAGVVVYKVFEPLILKIKGKSENQSDLMDARMRTVETKVSVLENQSRNVDKKLDDIDRKLDELLRGGK
jgi:chaperonin cofactor prefoldin